MTGRRAAAAGALAVGALTIAWALFLLVRRWPVDVVGPALLLAGRSRRVVGGSAAAGRRTVALGLAVAADARLRALIEIAGTRGAGCRTCGHDRGCARGVRARAARLRGARPAAARRAAVRARALRQPPLRRRPGGAHRPRRAPRASAGSRS